MLLTTGNNPIHRPCQRYSLRLPICPQVLGHSAWGVLHFARIACSSPKALLILLTPCNLKALLAWSVENVVPIPTRPEHLLLFTHGWCVLPISVSTGWLAPLPWCRCLGPATCMAIRVTRFQLGCDRHAMCLFFQNKLVFIRYNNHSTFLTLSLAPLGPAIDWYVALPEGLETGGCIVTSSSDGTHGCDLKGLPVRGAGAVFVGIFFHSYLVNESWNHDNENLLWWVLSPGSEPFHSNKCQMLDLNNWCPWSHLCGQCGRWLYPCLCLCF